MSTYSEYGKSFKEELLLLSSGIARLKRHRSKNWYEKLKDFANALAGGGMPSLDPNISRVKSKTNIYSGAEAMNDSAKKILESTASEYRMIYTAHFKNFYKISEEVLKLKRGNDFSFENIFSSDENLDKIRHLFVKLRTSDDTIGLIGGDENPRNLVIKIFKELTNVINIFYDSINTNISFLNYISNDLDNNQLSDYLEGPLINVCKQIYIFDKFLSSFTLAQPHRRAEKRLETIETPAGKIESSPAEDDGRRPLDYSAEGFFNGNTTSLENIERNNFKLSLPGSIDEEWSIPIILSRKDGNNVSSEEIKKINDNPIDFIKLLIKRNVLAPVKISADLIIKNIKSVIATPTNDNSKLIVDIKLNKEFKEKAYNEVAEHGAVIFEINNTNIGSPVGSVVKANNDVNLLKLAETATTPYYETISPSGEKIRFTPSDLVKGMGKLKDSSGKTFRPKKIKGKSLADKVISKNFGKIRK